MVGVFFLSVYFIAKTPGQTKWHFLASVFIIDFIQTW